MSFVLRTTTTSAPQNSVVVYVSHNLHRGVTDKIVVVVKLVVVAGNNTQRKRRKQRSPLRRTFSLLLFYSFLFLMLLFRVRFSSLLCRDDEMCVFVKKNIPFWQSRNFFLQIIFCSLLPLLIFDLEKKEAIFFTRDDGQMIFCAQSKNCTKITRTNNTNRKELTPFKKYHRVILKKNAAKERNETQSGCDE